MEKHLMNYESLKEVITAMSKSKDPKRIVQKTVDSVKNTLNIKGCALLLVNLRNNKLELAAAAGLSDAYLNKGPVSVLRSIDKSLTEGPVIIQDVQNDPRIQYAAEAKEEGIASILSVPIFVRGDIIGAMRVYTSDHWEFTQEDINFVQALAQIAGIVLDLTRLIEGQIEYIDVLETMREAREM